MELSKKFNFIILRIQEAVPINDNKMLQNSITRLFFEKKSLVVEYIPHEY